MRDASVLSMRDGLPKKIVKKPALSIITPVFKRIPLVLETMRSVQQQTWEDFECIVVDDGSSEEEFEQLCSGFEADERFKFHRRTGERKGATVCRNEAVAMARGEFMIFLDSDDLLLPHCLSERVARLRADERLDFIVTQTGVFTQAEQPHAEHYWSSLQHANDLDGFLLNQGWITSSTTFRSRFVRNIPFNETALCWGDYEFHLRVLLANPRYRKFPDSEPDWLYRAEPNRVSLVEITGVKAAQKTSDILRMLIDLEALISPEDWPRYEGAFLGHYLARLMDFALRQRDRRALDRMIAQLDASRCRDLLPRRKLQVLRALAPVPVTARWQILSRTRRSLLRYLGISDFGRQSPPIPGRFVNSRYLDLIPRTDSLGWTIDEGQTA